MFQRDTREGQVGRGGGEEGMASPTPSSPTLPKANHHQTKGTTRNITKQIIMDIAICGGKKLGYCQKMFLSKVWSTKVAVWNLLTLHYFMADKLWS